jgi:hypothetical protein
MSTLAERFSELLSARPDVKPVDLARACRIKQPSVSGWLNGKVNALEATNAIRAAAVFGVHTWWLVTGEGPKYLEKGEVDRHQPQVVSDEWPFSARFDEYSALSTADKRALDRVVTGFIAGAVDED